MKPLSIAELVADPDAALLRAREAGPVGESEMGPIAVGYEAVRTMLQDTRMRPNFPRLLEQRGVTSGPFYDWMSRSPLNMEGEEHRRWRQLLLKTFTPRSVEGLRPFLRSSAERLIDGFAELGRVEFVEEFARKLPSLGLCELIGVPAQDRERFSGWADTVGLGFNPMLVSARIRDVDQAIVQLLDYAKDLVAKRRQEPREDLVSRLALAAPEQGVDADTIHGTVAGLVFAGHETTKNQLGWLIAVLSEYPPEWERLAREPGRVKDVIEEVLRFRSAATSIGRLALEDVELFGTRISKGQFMIGSLWAANRDAATFLNPQSFDVDGNRNGAQIAFGAGAHHCLGAALARAELQESLVALTARITCPKVEAGATFLPPIGINGPTVLPITFKARSATE
jgi:cytochrome P450